MGQTTEPRSMNTHRALRSNWAKLVEAGTLDAPEINIDRVFDWDCKITKEWSRGACSTMELARVVSAAMNRLHRGQWTRLWKSGSLPFSKRKGEMLAVIGKNLCRLNAQTFAHLPWGWSILYQLAQLDRKTFEDLVEQGAIHPRLTLQDAQLL